jgi:hypothetical protein
LTARRHNRIDERENVLQDKIGLPVWTGVIDNDVLLLNLTQLFFKNKNLQENVDRFHIEKRKIPSRFCHPIRSDPIIFDRWSLCAIKTNILKSQRMGNSILVNQQRQKRIYKMTHCAAPLISTYSV